MGVIVKQGIKGTLFSYLGAFLGYANWVLLFPLFMNKSEMGFVRVLMDSALLLTTIFGLGIPQAIIRFYPFGSQKFSRTYFTTFGFIALWAGFLFIPLFGIFRIPIQAFFASKAPLFNEYIWFLIPIVLFGIAFDFFEAMNRIRLNISGAVFIKEVLFRLLITLLIVGFGLKLYDFSILVSLLVLCYGIQAFSMAYIFLRRWDPDASPLMPAKPSREQMKYMFLLFLGAGGTIIVNQIDSIMTGGMKGLDYAAVYAMAFFMSSVVYMPFRSVNSISSSVISAHFSSGNLEALRNMYRSSSINLFLVGSFIFLGIWCNMDLVFSLIPEDKSSDLSFSDGKWVFFILGLSRLFDMLMGINGMILINSRYYLWNILTMPLLAVITIVTNLLLIPVMGINGAALASLISILLFNAVRFAVIWKKLDMQPFTSESAKAVILFSLILIISLMFSFSWAPAQFFFSLLLVGLGYFIPAYLLRLSPELNDTLIRIGSKIMRS